MEMNVEKTKLMRISRQPLPVIIMIDQKQLENVESFKYLGSILTNDGRCTCEIKCRIVMAKAAFNKTRALFWFQTFAMFWMLFAFFGVIPWPLNHGNRFYTSSRKGDSHLKHNSLTSTIPCLHWHSPYLLHIPARGLHVSRYPSQPVSVLWPAPTLSPSFLMAQAISEPNLFPYNIPNISPA